MIAATFSMNFLSSPAPRPLLLHVPPGQPPRISGQMYAHMNAESANPLARKLLRTGQFTTTPPKEKPVTASQLLQASADQLSNCLSRTTNLHLQELCTEGPDEKEFMSLLVRFSTVLMYSLYDSRARYDKVRRGLLGRLLEDLSRAAAPLVPMFTPTTYTESDEFEEWRNDELLSEAVTMTYPGLKDGQYETLINKLSKRDRAKLAARHGGRTYLDFHEVGATLGIRKVFVPEHEVFSAVQSLPDDLRTGALKAMRLTRCLNALCPNERDQEQYCSDVLTDVDWGHLVFPAFMVIANREAEKDPLHEHLQEQWQMACEYGDTWPQLTLKLMSTSDYVRAARLLNHTCRALPLIQDALLALGAELC
ncbi:hypothetical protein Q0M94_25240 (plasmid) [Deinococcus radiomollis]|uniref:hypothetical protein n=1 Tax=Deinococcus radiomollis TaxID=468916 RepID=UPI003891B4C2